MYQLPAPRTAAAEHVVVVDDEPGIRQTISLALEREGYRVDAYPDGASAWEALSGQQVVAPQLAIVDIVMPGMDGLELCRRLRRQSESLPIVFLSSRDDEIDRVLGLELGADDYLGKPFSMRELVARVRVLFRRLALAASPQSQDMPAEHEERRVTGDLVLDSQRYRAEWRGQHVLLTVTEFLVLQALASRPGVVKTRAQLIGEGYEHDIFVSERTIDSHVKRIRRKFEAIDIQFAAVETVHGLGYRFREPTAASACAGDERRSG